MLYTVPSIIVFVGIRSLDEFYTTNITVFRVLLIERGVVKLIIDGYMLK